MKLIPFGPGGVLENVISLTGFENLCFMGVDNPELMKNIFNEVGSRLVEFYKKCGSLESVGAMISNDDWGFKTQTMLSPDDMKKYVIPWHKKICEAIHQAGKPAILHSCGNLKAVMDNVIDIGYDGKHSFEDSICPVEEAYETWGERIAVLGGIDMDFLSRAESDKIKKRSIEMLDRASSRGSYALGSGNSIPDYIPFRNFKAMIDSAISN